MVVIGPSGSMAGTVKNHNKRLKNATFRSFFNRSLASEARVGFALMIITRVLLMRIVRD